MKLTAIQKRFLGSCGLLGGLVAALLFLGGSEETKPVISERPALVLEGRLSRLSFMEQAVLAEVAPRRVREQSWGFRGSGTEKVGAQEAASRLLQEMALLDLSQAHFDEAIVKLEKAILVAPDSAELASDLAVVQLSRGRAQKDQYDFFLALKSADRAVRLDSDFLPARFNRALALTRVRLRAAADEAWTAYLASERDPSWLLEARHSHVAMRHFTSSVEDPQQVLEATVHSQDPSNLFSAVARSPRWFRENAEEVLLVAWADASIRGDEAAASRSLQQARWVGEALSSVHDDSILTGTLSQLEGLSARPETGAEIVRGLRAYGRGLALGRSDGYAAAQKSFGRAEALLSAAGSPFAAWARFQVALCYYQRTRYGESTRLFQQLAAMAASSRAWAVQGRSLMMLGLIELIAGDPSAALKHLESSLEYFRRLAESGYQAKVQGFMATAFDYLGDRHEAWRWLQAALVTEQDFRGEGAAGSTTHEVGAWLALKDEAPEIALLFQEEVVRAARRMGRASAVIEALRGRAAVLETAGRIADAQRDIEEARRELRKIGDSELARGIAGNLAFLEGQISREDSPAVALGRFDEAVEIFRSTSYSYRQVLALSERAQLSIVLGRTAPAERDLAEAIAESERQRLAIELPSHRISYFDQIRSLLDTMVDLQIRVLDRPQAALEYSERAKARVLWDWLKADPLAPVLDPGVEAALAPARVEDWQCELPAGSLAVEYAVLPDRLVIWSIEDCGRSVAEIREIGAEPLAALVREFRGTVLHNRGKRSEKLATELYELLIRPFAKHLAPGQPLVLIPDGPLHELPFSLLQDAATGRRLIQDHAVSLAPSLRILAASLRRDRALAQGRAPRALIVTAPKAAPEFGLSRLKFGAVEATIADFFPGSTVLPGKKATKAAFLASSRELEILHFGGHSVVNSDAPLLSRLFFSPDANDPSGVLYSRDLLKQRFPSARLAVLASCESGLGKLSKTEGVESLARPFLAIGVPGVIASLWRVEDEATAEFFVLFYSKLAETWNVAEALRETQVELIERDPTGSAAFKFGAFVFIGTSFNQ